MSIPVDGNDDRISKITKVSDASWWAVVYFDDGVVQGVKFYENRPEASVEFADFVILENKFENYMEFMEEGSMVLVVREEQTIEDIVEAFKFKELDEVGY